MNSLVGLILIGLAFMLGMVVEHRGNKLNYGEGYYEGKRDGIRMIEDQAIFHDKAIINGEYGFIWK